MSKGRAGADSSDLVTSQIGGKTLVDLATETLGEKPAFWGRYFTSAASTGVVEYRHLKEGQLLREKDIRVLPIARQTKRVHGTTAQGTVDAKLNAKDVLLTFGTDYLKSLGGKFLMFLDVESTPPLSLAYYLGNHDRGKSVFHRTEGIFSALRRRDPVLEPLEHHPEIKETGGAAFYKQNGGASRSMESRLSVTALY